MAAEAIDRSDPGVSGRGKKKLGPALNDLADGLGTSEPHLAAIYWAKRINDTLGGAFVAPWAVWELPNEWLDVFRGMGSLKQMMAGKKQVQDRLEQIKKERGWQ